MVGITEGEMDIPTTLVVLSSLISVDPLCHCKNTAAASQPIFVQLWKY